MRINSTGKNLGCNNVNQNKKKLTLLLELLILLRSWEIKFKKDSIILTVIFDSH